MSHSPLTKSQKLDIVAWARTGMTGVEIAREFRKVHNRYVAPATISDHLGRAGLALRKGGSREAPKKPEPRPIPEFQPPSCTAVREDSIIRPIPLSRLMGGK